MTPPKRARGTGSITPHQGGFWARLPVEGKTKSLGVHPTYEAAEAVLNKALIARASTPGASSTQHTFASFGRKVLDMREEEGVRNIAGERRSFKLHLETCAFADKLVADVTSADIADLLRALSNTIAKDRRGARKIKKESVQRYRTILSAIFNVAVERKMRPDNPCIGVKVRGKKRLAAEVDPDEDQAWDWLRGDEQRAFLACADIEPWFRALVRVAWGTGLRQGEMWNLEFKDLHMLVGEVCACGAPKCIRLREHGPHIHVRYGSRGHHPPKNGVTRRTPLFGEGMSGMREWLEILPTYAKENQQRLVFPTPHGCRRWGGGPKRSGRLVDGKQPRVDLLPEALAKIGVTRNIRWHDLRHTCASSLISGTWGRTWDLIKVRDMLGHKDIKTTQRYAHLASNVLHDEGAGTPGHVIERVMHIPTDMLQAVVISAQLPSNTPPAANASCRAVTVESKHEVRSIPNTSIAREAAYELLRLFGPDALKLALKLASESPGTDTDEKVD